MNKKMKLVFLTVVGLVMSIGSLGGLNPIGLAYGVSLLGGGVSFVLAAGVLCVGMIFKFSVLNIVKHMIVMTAIYIVRKIIESETTRISEYAIGIITTSIMLVVEYVDVIMTDSFSIAVKNQAVFNYAIIKPIVISVLAGGLVIIFSITENAFLKGKSMYTNEELVGIAVMVGLAVYNLGQNIVPGELVVIGQRGEILMHILSNSAMFFCLIYGAYKYGSGVGAILGAATGIAFCITNNDAKYLGVICMLGILIGMFREMGRFYTAIAVCITCVVAGLVFFKIFLDEEIVKGMFAGVVTFLMLPSMLVYRIEERNNQDEALEMQKMCEEKLVSAAKAVDRISKSIGKSYEGCKLAVNGNEEGAIHAIWQDKMAENRKMVSGQLNSISKMIEEYSKEIYNFINISLEQEENICHILKGKKVFVEKIVGIENRHGKKEYLVTAKCQKGITIGTREVARALSTAFGREYVPTKNCRKILANEYTTTTYVEKANFYVAHGVARRAVGRDGISGDNYSLKELDNGQVLMGISDGMGYGASASLESERVIELLEQLLESGFESEVALKMINSVMVMNNDEDHPATLDCGVINLNSGICNIAKVGAAATFLRRGSWVEMLKSTSMPLGMFGELDLDCVNKKLYDGDEIIMVSDGVLDALLEENKEEKMAEIIGSFKELTPEGLATAILETAVSDKSRLTDDMTVLVTRIWNNDETEDKKIA